MIAPHSSRRGAVATYVLVALVALLIGAVAMQSYTAPAESPEPVVNAATTHGEWVSIKRGRDSIRA